MAVLWAIPRVYGNDVENYKYAHFCSTAINCKIAEQETEIYGGDPSEIEEILDQDVWYYLQYDYSAVYDVRDDGDYWYQEEIEPSNEITLEMAYQNICSRLRWVNKPHQ